MRPDLDMAHTVDDRRRRRDVHGHDIASGPIIERRYVEVATDSPGMREAGMR